MFKNVSLLVDTSHLAYRVFFAFQQVPSDVVRENMLYGVLNSLRSLIHKLGVSQIFLVWDRGYVAKAALYPGYKKKSDIMTEEQRQQFSEQITTLYDFLLCLGMKCCYQEGVEADDIIAFLVNERRIRVQGTNDFIEATAPIVIVSGDRDLYPLLLDEEVALWKPHKEGLYTANDFRREFDLEPVQYADVQTLMGCASDKIPGVRGIGQKFAVNLIKRFGSVKALKGATEDERLVNLVQKHWSDVELSSKLVAFESVDPVIPPPIPNLSKVRKLLYAWDLVEFLEDWSFMESLSQL